MGDPVQYGFVERQDGSGARSVRADGVLLEAYYLNSYFGYTMPVITMEAGVLEVNAIIMSDTLSSGNGFRMLLSNGTDGSQLCVRRDFGLYTETTGGNQIGLLDRPDMEHMYRIRLTPEASSYWVDETPVAIDVPHSQNWVINSWICAQDRPTQVLLRGMKLKVGRV